MRKTRKRTNFAHELDELESVAEEDRAPEDRERLAAIKARLAELDAKQAVYSDEQKAKAGAFVSLDTTARFSSNAATGAMPTSLAEANSPAASAARGHDRDPDDDGMPYETGEPDDAAASMPISRERRRQRRASRQAS